MIISKESKKFHFNPLFFISKICKFLSKLWTPVKWCFALFGSNLLFKKHCLCSAIFNLSVWPVCMFMFLNKTSNSICKSLTFSLYLILLLFCNISGKRSFSVTAEICYTCYVLFSLEAGGYNFCIVINRYLFNEVKLFINIFLCVIKHYQSMNLTMIS